MTADIERFRREHGPCCDGPPDDGVVHQCIKCGTVWPCDTARLLEVLTPDVVAVAGGEGGDRGWTIMNRQEVLPLVLADLDARVRKGAAEYGEPLTTHNGRNALQDAYEEILDTALYLKQAILEAQA